MEVILAIIEDCGYCDSMVVGYRSYSVFSSMEKVKEFLASKYVCIEDLKPINTEVDSYHRCTTSNRDVHYIWLMKKTLV